MYGLIFLFKNNVAKKNESAWRYLAAIQSWVGRFASYPGKIFIPLYASIWIESISPMKRDEIPIIIKKEFLIFLREFQVITNIPSAIIMLNNSTRLWKRR